MLGRALLFTLRPARAAAPGDVAVARQPGERLTSALQHFAAGVVFAAAAIELLPDVLRQSPVVAISGFAVGIAVMFSFREVSERTEPAREVRGQQGLPVGRLAATGVDCFIDGVILGAGFAAGSTLQLCSPSRSSSSTCSSGCRCPPPSPAASPGTAAAAPVSLACLPSWGPS